MSQRTNFDYLREYIEDNDTALEFFDAIVSDYEDLKSNITELEDDKKVLETEKSELESAIEELKEAPLNDVLDCGIGKIEYRTDNLQLDLLMDALSDKIDATSPLHVLQLLQK